MNILLVGSGGREHALAWKIAASPKLTRLVAAPGNPGMAQCCEVRKVGVTDVPALVDLAREIAADLVVIGPEAAVAAGLADAMLAAGFPCFGPTAAAGRLESSKAFTKGFCDRHGLPTARYRVCEDAATAKAALADFEAPYVIKADGLAAGKGVVVAQTRAEAEAAIDDALGGRFGAAGSRVVVEEFLDGEIGSLFALCDGRNVMLFGEAQDHKRAFDGEQGPNTGGMGTYSPAPVFTPEVIEAVRTRLVEPAFAGIAAEGAPYHGVLFVELMVTRDGPKLIEFNVRFGDPETQAVLPRLKSDLLDLLQRAVTPGGLEGAQLEWDDRAAVTVVLASRGYPASSSKGDVIEGLDAADAEVTHAGTALENGNLVTAGGRVLNVTALGADREAARAAAYAAADKITFPGKTYRRDIAA